MLLSTQLIVAVGGVMMVVVVEEVETAEEVATVTTMEVLVCQITCEVPSLHRCRPMVCRLYRPSPCLEVATACLPLPTGNLTSHTIHQYMLLCSLALLCQLFSLTLTFVRLPPTRVVHKTPTYPSPSRHSFFLASNQNIVIYRDCCKNNFNE